MSQINNNDILTAAFLNQIETNLIQRQSQSHIQYINVDETTNPPNLGCSYNDILNFFSNHKICIIKYSNNKTNTITYGDIENNIYKIHIESPSTWWQASSPTDILTYAENQIA